MKHELLKLLDDYLDGLEGDYVASVVADRFVTFCLAEHREALVGWLLMAAPAIITGEVARRDRQARRHLRRREFREAAEQFGRDGDTAALLRAFDVHYVIDEQDTRRRVGDMTAADHLFVARRYTVESNRQKLLAQFHLAVAKRLTGGKRTEDVFDEATYLALQDSILGATA